MTMIGISNLYPPVRGVDDLCLPQLPSVDRDAGVAVEVPPPQLQGGQRGGHHAQLQLAGEHGASIQGGSQLDTAPNIDSVTPFGNIVLFL